MLSGNESQLETKTVKSVDQVISELKTPLSSTVLHENYCSKSYSFRGVEWLSDIESTRV